MLEDVSIVISDEDISNWDETPLHHKMRRSNVVVNEESMVSSEYNNENFGWAKKSLLKNRIAEQ